MSHAGDFGDFGDLSMLSTLASSKAPSFTKAREYKRKSSGAAGVSLTPRRSSGNLHVHRGCRNFAIGACTILRVASILRSILSMSLATSISRLTGFVRVAVQASVLSTGVVANAYAYSNVLPNQIYELFMGGLLSSIFIPLLVSRLANHGEEDARNLAGALATVILPILAVVSIAGAAFSAPLVNLATNFESERTTELAILMFRVFALQIFFYGAGALAIGILNTHRRFFLPTIAPVLNNVAVIATLVAYALVAPRNFELAVYILAGGTTLGVAAMSGMLLPAVWRLGYRPRMRVSHPALASVGRLAAPMVVFVASSVGVQFAANYLGSSFDGNASLLYAFTIFQLPYGVFIVAIATALMPELSERFSRGDTDGYRENLSFGLRTMAFIAVPATVGMAAFSALIIGLLYERGGFEASDTSSVSLILAAYAVGLLGYGAYFVLVRSFYSRQNTKTPAVLNVGLLALYIVLGYALSETFGLVGVALAFSASYAALAIALLIAMRRDIGRIDGKRIAASLAKILTAGAVMHVVAEGGIYLLGTGSTLPERVLVLALAGGASVAAYLAAAYVFRAEELRSAATLLRRRSVKEAKQSSEE